MIAAIEWIPKGRANPTPSKYEYSRAEQEFLDKVSKAGDRAEELLLLGGGASATGGDEEWQDVDEDSDDDNTNDDGEVVGSSKSTKKKIELPKIDPKSLPDDLNMDDYSDDDDDDEDDGGGVNERAVGNLLGVGKVCVLCICILCCYCVRRVKTYAYDMLSCFFSSFSSSKSHPCVSMCGNNNK